VAFIFNARLFVAEHADLKARSAKPRLLADVRLVPPESAPPGTDPKAQQYAEPVLAPRWSPDGTRIAFLRPSPPPGGKDELCVVDVITGKESVAANDTIAGIGVFGQPWSPDGKSLAYAAAVTTSGGYTPAGINVVAATGGKPRTAIERGSRVACSASWSPNGNRLAYVGPLWSAGIIGSALPTVFVSDIDGKNAAPVTADVPSESKRAAAEVQMRERLIKMLKEKYPGVFSAAQLKEFARKRLADIQAIVILASAESVRQLEADIKHFPTGDKNKLSAGGAVGEAVEKLPKEQQGKLKEKLTQLVLEVIRPLLNLKASLDTDPVWSPDGANLAYTRWNFTSGVMQLVIVDLATRKARTVFESNTIECVSWTADGKSLVLQARRNLAYKGKSDTAKNPWPDFITMPSYPEIWLLDLK
jgi:dipeptidyl aminopeptidase/acylaminoacyl peptidase